MKQTQKVDSWTWVLEKLVVLLDIPCNSIRVSTHILFKTFCVFCLAVEQNIGYFYMKQFLFDFRIHENLIGDVGFQKGFVDMPLEPTFRE